MEEHTAAASADDCSDTSASNDAATSSPLRGLARGEALTAVLVDSYLTSIADTVYLAYPTSVCRAALHTGFDGLITALSSTQFSPSAGTDFAHILVSLQITVPAGATAGGLAIAGLPSVLSPEPSTELLRRATLLLAEFSGGFADALSRTIIDSQAVVQRAAEIARRKAEEGERQAQARLRVMFEHAHSAVFVADGTGKILDASPVMRSIMDANRTRLGIDGENVLGLLAEDPSDALRTLQELAEADDDTITRFLEHRELGAQNPPPGHPSIGRWALSRVRSHDDRPALIVGVGHDVSELRALHAQLSHLANHDPLTSLPNRRRLADDLSALVALPVGFCLIDLDDFKSFNDELGHAVGDQLLVATAHRMQAAIGGTGTLYRVGGDEFAVVVSAPFRPRDVTELLHRSLSTPLDVRTSDGDPSSRMRIRIGASIGSTVSSPEGSTVEALIAAADAGLYRSKEARRI